MGLNIPAFRFARDASFVIFFCLTLLVLSYWPRAVAAQTSYSLRFYGAGARDADRVKIPLDAPHRPVDVGAADFTLEFWMRAMPGANPSGACTAGADTWIAGNILFDRDIFGAGDYGDYGVSLYGGRIAFGVATAGASRTICGATSIADGAWHHVAVSRRAGDGMLSIYVDGVLDAQGAGPLGNLSYRDGRPAQWPNEPYLVIGAEKHDYDRNAYPSFNGWIDEVRISNIERYTGAFARPTQPFAPDPFTVGLYHFDEGSGVAVADSSGAAGGPSHGMLFIDTVTGGPAWSTDIPPWAGSSTAVPSTTSAPTATAVATNTSAPTATAVPTNTPAPTNTSTPTATAAIGGSANLLANGGFEFDANGDNRPDSWTSNARVTRSAVMARGGSYALRHYANNNAGYAISQLVTGISAGAAYELSGYINIPPTTDAFTFNVRIRWVRGDGTIARTDMARSFAAATSGWEPARIVAVAPTGALQARIEMQVASLNATIYADDFSFAAVNAPTAMVLAASPTATTVPPSPTTTAAPIAGAGGALAFDGVNDEASSAAVTLSGAFTIEAWLRPDVAGQSAVVIVSGDGSRGWSLELNDGRVTLWVANSAGVWAFARNPAALQAGQWQHIAATYENGSARVFVNGAAGPATAVATVNHMPALRLGGLAGYGHVAGQIDEVRLSRIVRYPASFAAPPAPLAPDADTLALYAFDERGGQSVADRSGNGYHLTLGQDAGVDPADPLWIDSTAPGR